ncbi:unnamed protein product [Prorocentrum cordatum]|uniref:Uncharacterized protein n=1 Tax=Prorocentrum cordatum TaxID=2364126 RepID=A0ABN9U135_9DINO|nr:unnamed protein product [Polarella glacialis]
MSGCRAPELAGGKLKDVSRVMRGDIECELAAALSNPEAPGQQGPESHAKIMEAFRTAQVTMNGILHEKLSFWTQLPRALAGVAHRSEDVAVSVARDALRTFDGLSGEETAAVAAGAEMRSECSESFLMELIKFKRMPINEVDIEGKHAVVTRTSAHLPFGPIRVSLCNRMKVFIDQCNRWGDDCIDSFLKHLETRRGPTAVPAALEFDPTQSWWTFSCVSGPRPEAARVSVEATRTTIMNASCWAPCT